jgi:hypothetical protein
MVRLGFKAFRRHDHVHCNLIAPDHCYSDSAIETFTYILEYLDIIVIR